MLLKYRKIFIIYLTALTSQNAYSDSAKKSQHPLDIQGDDKSLDISDIPLPEYKYDELNLFDKYFDPQTKLLSVLDKTETLMDLDTQTTALDFDEPLTQR